MAKSRQASARHGGHDDGPKKPGPTSHKRHRLPYEDPDYEHPPQHGHEPPIDLRYPDAEIYGTYASQKPPRYVPHPFDHLCFKPRKDDYKPPTTCEEPDDELCVRKDHRTLTSDE
jgi:tyrosinase